MGRKFVLRRRRNREAECLAAYEPGIELFRPETPAGPLILASPHSGRIYPEALLERSSLPLRKLRQNEDCYIDQILGFARHMDIPFISALFPRCFVDVNRDASELPQDWLDRDEAIGTARAEIGLGVIPTIIAEKTPIYNRPLKAKDAMPRLDALYHPYHQALAGLINDALQSFGQALLLDCHSMPGFTQLGQRRADIVLGDRHGISCRPETISRLEVLLKARGYSVTRNHPYAGGYVTSHYGRPENNVEVIQIEINKDLYLNPVSFARKPGYARLTNDLREICWELLPRTAEIPLAAE